MVLEVLANAATLYSRKFGEIPVLCIDGVDLLAKREEMLCEALITLAKVLANSNKLKLVLISSEGGIMPFLERLSVVNRACVYEIGDLNDNEAVSFLLKNNMKESRAKKLVQCLGGRLVYLQSSVNHDNKNWKDEDICKNIKVALFSRILSNQKAIISKTQPESEDIVAELTKNGSASPSKLIDIASNKSRMDSVIKMMGENNIVRYNMNGNMKWHGKVQQDEIPKTIPVPE